MSSPGRCGATALSKGALEGPFLNRTPRWKPADNTACPRQQASARPPILLASDENIETKHTTYTHTNNMEIKIQWSIDAKKRKVYDKSGKESTKQIKREKHGTIQGHAVYNKRSV